MLRDVLLQLATTGLFRARWTDQIHDEWIENLLSNRSDLDRAKLERTRDCMDRAVLDCLVTGYEGLADGIALPDPSDRHVVATAIPCHAALIVTANIKDFPKESLQPLGIKAEHPDNFIADLIDIEPGRVVHAMNLVRHRLTKPKYSAAEFLTSLGSQGLFQTHGKLQQYADSI